MTKQFDSDYPEGTILYYRDLLVFCEDTKNIFLTRDCLNDLERACWHPQIKQEAYCLAERFSALFDSLGGWDMLALELEQ